MQDWFETLTIGNLVAWTVTVTAVIVAITPAVKIITRLIKGTNRFLDAWNGTDDVLDKSGEIVEPGKPGVPAILERVRKQVENDHTTNFREDLDVVQKIVEQMESKLDEHIVISKHHDREQSVTARKLDTHVNQTEEMLPMLNELHDRWEKHYKKRSDR